MASPRFAGKYKLFQILFADDLFPYSKKLLARFSFRFSKENAWRIATRYVSQSRLWESTGKLSSLLLRGSIQNCSGEVEAVAARWMPYEADERTSWALRNLAIGWSATNNLLIFWFSSPRYVLNPVSSEFFPNFSSFFFRFFAKVSTSPRDEAGEQPSNEVKGRVWCQSHLAKIVAWFISNTLATSPALEREIVREKVYRTVTSWPLHFYFASGKEELCSFKRSVAADIYKWKLLSELDERHADFTAFEILEEELAVP